MARSHLFDIEPKARFAAINAAVRRPKEITYFSYDEEHRLRMDDSSLRFYYPPTLPTDLNEGFDQFRHLDDTADEHLDGLLDALIHFEATKATATDADFVTWRGMMTKIMVTPFSMLDSWEMNATLFQGTIFIEENHSKKLSSREEQYSSGAGRGAMSQDLMSYWGYKFEAVSLLDRPWSDVSREYIESREKLPVSNYSQYCSIVRTGLGKTKMIIGGEVDAVKTTKPEDKTQSIDWVELKTSAEVLNDRDQVKFERKLLKFWAQSFLLGVPNIIVGFRDQQGILRRLEEMDTQSIPHKVQTQGKRLWDGQICINFTSTFLEWLKTVINGDGVWRIRKREKAPVLELFKMEETGHGEILSSKFVEWRTVGLPASQRDEEEAAEPTRSHPDKNYIEESLPP